MSGLVTVEDAAPGIVRLVLENGAANALDGEMRAALAGALEAVLGDPAIHAVLIAGAGPGFSMGLLPPDHDGALRGVTLGAVCARLDRARVPVVAELHGMAMGGGCELALACHYRVALQGAQLGLPDIALGLPPGAGTTQRLPRLTGIEDALDLLLTGQPVDAGRAQGMGLVDALVAEDLPGAALRFAEGLIAEGAGPRPATDRALPGFGGLHGAIAARRAALPKSDPIEAPSRVLDCVDAAAMLPVGAALEFESAAYEDCRDSAAFRALRHLALAEARARRQARGWEGAARPADRVGIWGWGPNAAALAATLLTAGATVRMAAPEKPSLTKGVSRVDTLLTAAGGDAKARAAHWARFSGASGVAGVSGCGTIIEAGTGPWPDRERAFAAIASAAPGDAILTATGLLGCASALATVGRRPAQTLWLNLPELVPGARLAELVRTRETAAATVAGFGALMERILRFALVATGESPVLGLLVGALEAGDAMVEAGASPYAIDAALRDWGLTLGPYEIADRLGLETLLGIRAGLPGGDDPQARPILVLGQMVVEDRLGRAAGQGYYSYADGARHGRPDPKIDALLHSAREVLDRPSRSFEPAEICARVLAGMAQAGAGLLRRGAVARAAELDLAAVHGLGLARWRGGPMRAADEHGMLWLRKTLREMAAAPGGSEIWMPDPLIGDLIKEGRGFTDPERSA